MVFTSLRRKQPKCGDHDDDTVFILYPVCKVNRCIVICKDAMDKYMNFVSNKYIEVGFKNIKNELIDASVST